MNYETALNRYLTAAKRRRDHAKKLKQRGMTNAEIGRRMGVTRQRAQQIVDSKP